jgi:hypothetical protein
VTADALGDIVDEVMEPQADATVADVAAVVAAVAADAAHARVVGRAGGLVHEGAVTLLDVAQAAVRVHVLVAPVHLVFAVAREHRSLRRRRIVEVAVT